MPVIYLRAKAGQMSKIRVWNRHRVRAPRSRRSAAGCGGRQRRRSCDDPPTTTAASDVHCHCGDRRSTSTPAATGDAAAGKTLFEGNCQGCHARDGTERRRRSGACGRRAFRRADSNQVVNGAASVMPAGLCERRRPRQRGRICPEHPVVPIPAYHRRGRIGSTASTRPCRRLLMRRLRFGVALVLIGAVRGCSWRDAAGRTRTRRTHPPTPRRSPTASRPPRRAPPGRRRG